MITIDYTNRPSVGGSRIVCESDYTPDWDLDTARVERHTDFMQSKGGTPTGWQLLKHLKLKCSLMRAEVLIFLLENQELIPFSWQTTVNASFPYILFPGTVYKGRLHAHTEPEHFIRALMFVCGKWDETRVSLNEKLSSYHQTPTLKPSPVRAVA